MDYITSILNELFGQPLETVTVYFLCVVIGVCLNWAKRSNELGISLLAYWRQNPVRTQAALIGTFSAFFFTITTDPSSGKLTYVTIGYAFDSLLNKAPNATSDKSVMAKQEAELAVQKQKIIELEQGIKI